MLIRSNFRYQKGCHDCKHCCRFRDNDDTAEDRFYCNINNEVAGHEWKVKLTCICDYWESKR